MLLNTRRKVDKSMITPSIKVLGMDGRTAFLMYTCSGGMTLLQWKLPPPHITTPQVRWGETTQDVLQRYFMVICVGKENNYVLHVQKKVWSINLGKTKL